MNRRVGLLLGAALAWVLLGASCEDRVLSVAIDPQEDQVMLVGETLQLTANVTATGRASRAVTWSSGDDDVAIVTPGGLVRATGAGATDIVATSAWDPAMAAEIELTVSAPAWTLSVSREGPGAGSITSNPPGIDCGSTCAADFDDGTDVTLTATPAEASTFTGWTGACTGTSTCTVAMTEARSVTATFDVAPPPGPHTLSVARAGTGTGSITSNPPGIDCGSTCTADYDDGTDVTLTATPAEASTFTGWTGACTGTSTCTVAMTQARSVGASFDLEPAIEVTPASRDVGAVEVGGSATTTFTVRNAGGGTLAGSASVSSPFAIAAGGAYVLAADQSATVTVRFSPTEVGPVTRDVTFGGDGGASRSVRGEGVAATVRLSVEVVEGGYGRVISEPPGIDCTTACAADFPLGATVTLTATPLPDHGVSHWVGCQPTGWRTCTVELTEARSVDVHVLSLPGLWIDRAYANQAVPAQDSWGDTSQRIPLVANRAGLLRVFASSFHDLLAVDDAEVRLHYRHAAGEPETVVPLDGPTSFPPGVGWEGGFHDNFAIRLEPDVMRAGLQLYLTATGTSLDERITARYPDSGFWDLHVVAVPTLDLKLVPVTYRGTTPPLGDGRAYLDRTQRMFPFPDDGILITIGAAYAFDGDLSTSQGWTDLIEGLWWQRIWDPGRPHYYGVVNAGTDRIYNGVGYVGHPVAVGYSTLPGAADTAAHELGHNWGRLHAPCGGPDYLDPDFPYPDGHIGVWGYDLTDRQLRSPTEFADLMSYCRPRWVSDYTYRGVMDFRTYVTASALADGFADAAEAPAPGAAELLLVVTGTRDGDDWRLEAPFVLHAAPEPIPDGPYRLHAWDAAGATVVDVAFGTVPLSHPEGTEAILLTVPLGRADTPQLAGLRIEERGRVLFERTALLRPLAARATQATRLADGSVQVTWDTQAYAAALVLDGVRGPLLARDRSGDVVVMPTGDRLEVLLSDGLNTVVEVIAP